MEVKAALPLRQDLKNQEVLLKVNGYEAFLILDALAGFKPTDEWNDLYQKVGRQAFEQTD